LTVCKSIKTTNQGKTRKYNPLIPIESRTKVSIKTNNNKKKTVKKMTGGTQKEN
jgi:hypothetical protein